MNSIRKMLPIKSELGIEGYRIPSDGRVEHLSRRNAHSYLGKKPRDFPFAEIVKSQMVVKEINPEAKTKVYTDAPSSSTYQVVEPPRKYYLKLHRNERKTEINEWFER